MKKIFGEKGQCKSRTRDQGERESNGNICKMKHINFGVGAAKGSSLQACTGKNILTPSLLSGAVHLGGTEGAVRTCSLTASPRQNPPVALHYC